MNMPDFTGERFIPGQGGAQITYEHLHRYYFARRWAAGKEVLDVAAGVGYGAALLGREALRVWAIDIDARSLQHARRTYGTGHLEFLQGDVTHLPFRSRSLDLVVAFEVLEHVEPQEELVAELARVVRENGTVLISTPNKATYSDARGYHNPFHVRELYRNEFGDLLGRHFPASHILHQQVRAGSFLQGEPGAAAGAEIICEAGAGAPPHEPMYLLAICRRHGSPVDIPAASAFLDSGDQLMREWELEFARLNEEVRNLGIWARNLEDLVQARDRLVHELQGEMEDRNLWALKLEREVAARDEALRLLQVEFEGRTRWAQELAGEVASRDERLGRTQAELDRVADHLAHIRHALPYRILCRLGILPK